MAARSEGDGRREGGLAAMRGALARKKKVPAWLKQKDYLNAKLGREELVDRLHVRPACCRTRRRCCRRCCAPTGRVRDVCAAQVVCEWVSDVDPDVSTSSFDVLAEAVVQPSIMRHKCAARPLRRLSRLVHAPGTPPLQSQIWERRGSAFARAGCAGTRKCASSRRAYSRT